MNQSLFKPRALLLATALAAAGVVGAQSTYTPSATSTATTPPPASSVSSAPCIGKEGAALSECLKNSTASAGTSASASTSTPSTSMSGNTSTNAVGSTSMDSSSSGYRQRQHCHDADGYCETEGRERKRQSNTGRIRHASQQCAHAEQDGCNVESRRHEVPCGIAQLRSAVGRPARKLPRSRDREPPAVLATRIRQEMSND